MIIHAIHDKMYVLKAFIKALWVEWKTEKNGSESTIESNSSIHHDNMLTCFCHECMNSPLLSTVE